MTRDTAPVGVRENKSGSTTERAQALSESVGCDPGVRPEDVGTSLLGSRIVSAARTAASLHAQVLCERASRDGAVVEGENR